MADGYRMYPIIEHPTSHGAIRVARRGDAAEVTFTTRVEYDQELRGDLQGLAADSLDGSYLLRQLLLEALRHIVGPGTRTIPRPESQAAEGAK